MAQKTYKVTGPFETYDTAPGGTFKRALDPEHEKILLEQGAIEIVTEKKAASSSSGSKQGTSASSAASESGGGS